MPQHTAPIIPIGLNVTDRLGFINQAQDFFPADVTGVAPTFQEREARSGLIGAPQGIGGTVPEDFLPAIEQEQPFSPFDEIAGPTTSTELTDIFGGILEESEATVRGFTKANRARTRRIQELIRSATKKEKKGLGEKIAPFAELAGLIVDATSGNPFVRGRAGAQATATREARVGRRARRRAGRLQTAQQLVASEEAGGRADLASLNATLKLQGVKTDVARAGQPSAKDFKVRAEFRELQTAKQYQDALNAGEIGVDQIPPRYRGIIRDELHQNLESSQDFVTRTKKDLVEFFKEDRKAIRESEETKAAYAKEKATGEFVGSYTEFVVREFNRLIDSQMRDLLRSEPSINEASKRLGFDPEKQSRDDFIRFLSGGAVPSGPEQQFEGVDPDVAGFLQAGGR